MDEEFIQTLHAHASEEPTLKDTCLYGYVVTTVVGIRYAPGAKNITANTWMVVAREPENEYDSNAARIDTINGLKVGYINRAFAKKIQPIVDGKEVQVAILALDSPDTYDLRAVVVFYGSSDKGGLESVKNTLKNGTWFPPTDDDAPPKKKKRKVGPPDEGVDRSKRRFYASLAAYQKARTDDLPFKSGFRLNLESAMEEYRKHHDPVEKEVESAFTKAIEGKTLVTIKN